MPDNNSIWLEVESVRTENGSSVEVTLKGDRSKERWRIAETSATLDFKTLMDALDAEHVVLAELGPRENSVGITKLRIERKETHAR